MQDSIKACPHCGGSAYLVSNCTYKTWTAKNYSMKKQVYFVMVKCTVCGAQGKIYSSGQDDPAAEDWNNAACYDAVNAWNMRTPAADAD